MNYSHLTKISSPRILVEALKLVGTKEIVGIKNSATIMGWAKELKIQKTYLNDEIPWCGLFMAYVCLKAGLDPGMKGWEVLRALKWNAFGTRQKTAMLGDVLTFTRNGGGHVGIYVGEDTTCYHVLGGNQSNMVSITRLEKKRCSQIRRTKWKIAQPEAVKVVMVNPRGFISKNEA